MQRNSLRRGFAALEMLYWVTYGSFTTYLVSMVRDTRSATASAAGALLALFMASACLGQYVMGSLCDRRQNNRRVFMVNMALIIFVQLGIYFSPTLPMMAVGCVALGFIQPPTGALLDTWLIRSFPQEPGAYAPIRAYGSLAYAALMASMGLLIDRVGYAAMPVASSVFAMAAIAVAWRMPEIPPMAAGAGGEKARLGGTVWLFVAAVGVLGVANVPELNMNRMILDSVGGTVVSVGIATAFNTVAEFLVMRLPNPARRLPPAMAMLLSGGLYVCATLLMLLSRSVGLMYAAFFVNGLAYGIFLPARRGLVNDIVPQSAHNRVHGLGDMAYLNFGGLVGNLTSGVIMDNFSVPFLLRLCGGVQVAALALVYALKRAVGGKR